MRTFLEHVSISSCVSITGISVSLFITKIYEMRKGLCYQIGMYRFGNNSLYNLSEKSSPPLLQTAELMIRFAIFVLLCNIHVPWVLFLDALIESASFSKRPF